MVASRWWAFEGDSAVAVGEKVGAALLDELGARDLLDTVAEAGGEEDLKQALIDVVWKTLNPQEQ
jgi:hypothetical protein